MSRPRPVVAGRTYLITRRCTQRGLWLVPRQLFHEIVGFCLTVAAQRHGMLVHHVICLSNHVHMVVTDPHGERPAFMRDFLSQTSRAVNAELGREENLWDSRGYSALYLPTADDVFRKLVYSLANAVSHGLVRNHKEWPGLRTLACDMLGKRRTFRRIGRFLTAYQRDPAKRDEVRPPTLKLELTVPPQFAHMSKQDFVAELDQAVADREAELQRLAEQEGRDFLGADAVTHQEVGATPKTPREPLGTANPTFAAADKELRKQLAVALRTFRTAYKQARRRWLRDGASRAVIFPEGTYELRDRPNVVVQEPLRAPS